MSRDRLTVYPLTRKQSVPFKGAPLRACNLPGITDLFNLSPSTGTYWEHSRTHLQRKKFPTPSRCHNIYTTVAQNALQSTRTHAVTKSYHLSNINGKSSRRQLRKKFREKTYVRWNVKLPIIQRAKNTTNIGFVAAHASPFQGQGDRSWRHARMVTLNAYWRHPRYWERRIFEGIIEDFFGEIESMLDGSLRLVIGKKYISQNGSGMRLCLSCRGRKWKKKRLFLGKKTEMVGVIARLQRSSAVIPYVTIT